MKQFNNTEKHRHRHPTDDINRVDDQQANTTTNQNKRKKRGRRRPQKLKAHSSPQHLYYPEEILIDLVQRDVFSWVDFVTHHSRQWHEEYVDFCREQGMAMCNETALAYISFRNDLEQEGMEAGWM